MCFLLNDTDKGFNIESGYMGSETLHFVVLIPSAHLWQNTKELIVTTEYSINFPQCIIVLGNFWLFPRSFHTDDVEKFQWHLTSGQSVQIFAMHVEGWVESVKKSVYSIGKILSVDTGHNKEPTIL